MFKKKKVRVTTMFDLPAEELAYKIVEVKNYVYNIIESDKFVDIATKVPVPVNATSKDINKLIKDFAPKKVKSIIELIFEDNFDDIMHILATIFCEDYKLYKTKNLNQIIEQIESLKASQIGVIIQLFMHAGR